MSLESLFTLVAGALLSWLASRYYYRQSSTDLESGFKRVSKDLARRETIEEFERLLAGASWEKQFRGNREVHVCRTDPMYQFEIGEDSRQYFEPWMSVFPDRTGSAFEVSLHIRGSVVKTLHFVSADGGRYTLPMPRVYLVDGSQAFAWRRESIECKVANVIGDFYRCSSLEEVARLAKIDFVDDRHA